MWEVDSFGGRLPRGMWRKEEFLGKASNFCQQHVCEVRVEQQGEGLVPHLPEDVSSWKCD